MFALEAPTSLPVADHVLSALAVIHRLRSDEPQRSAVDV